MDTELGLQPHHEQTVKEYLRFTRYKRSECLRCIKSSYNSISESHLIKDNTFTSQEVQEMLSGMWSVMEADLEAELISSSHMSALLLQQLFQQADHVHLKMKLNVAELENKELLEGMAAYERHILSNSSSSLFSPVLSQLEPLNFGGEKLLQQEIQRLKDENKKLKEQMKMLETKTTSILQEKEKLKSHFSQPVLSRTEESRKQDDEASGLQEIVTRLRSQLTLSDDDTKILEKKLSDTTENFLRVNSELERTKKELQKKFCETAQYETMRKVLVTKNEQIKDLRKRLKPYEK